MVAFSKVLATNPSKFLTPKISAALISTAACGIFLMWRKQLRDHEERRKRMDARDLHISLEQVSRTYCDVWMIHNGTVIERSIIGGDYSGFKDNLLEFAYAMPLISIINNLLKYGLNMLKLRFRKRLTLYLTEKYLSGFTYYKMSNLDNRIANADQLLTQDVDKFCACLAELYSNVSKPLLDIVIYVHKLSGAIGVQGPAYMLLYLAVSGLVLTRMRRPVGKMTVEEQHLEGEFRYVNSRLITNSEEIAFYQGHIREKSTIESTFGRLVDHLKDFVKFRFSMGIIDNVIAKYLATVCGFYVVSRPFLSPKNTKLRNSAHDVRMEDYYRSGRMLVKMAEAIGRLVLAGREMTRLAGFTARVSELMSVLKDLNNGVYQRTLIANKREDENDKKEGKKISTAELTRKRGQIVEKDHLIRFENVPLVTPNGDVLVENMTFEVQLGYILEREGGWNAIQDWMDVLSGGEKQRIAMARLFYHKPQFAILDECTSAVSVDVEGFMYTHCREYVLYMDGRGSYEFNTMEKTNIDFGS
ncbi:ATP-binding cassette sub-family D member 3 [Exaiptasia diaphana]|nr:ATP-binding cassette sub-family D member 3 [Exaiptasia diaphana]